ncbi:MAG: Na+/H+ antiporter NhaC family protein, partial [Bacteroidaceae bacterium]|nr:Na+/H+ antiporter NhaC family protein [Bacteroidaceae bacterium]
GEGIMGMSELIIVTLLAAGLMGVIRHLGGIDFLLQRLSRVVSGSRGAELCIAFLTVVTNICTANNTIAILTAGPLAKEISRKYGIEPQRTASLLDTFSCFTQAFIPYGAQLLMAAGIAMLNPLDIIPYLYYPFILGACALGHILLKRTKKHGTD